MPQKIKNNKDDRPKFGVSIDSNFYSGPQSSDQPAASKKQKRPSEV